MPTLLKPEGKIPLNLPFAKGDFNSPLGLVPPFEKGGLGGIS